ncbi:MAG TPA: DNA replication/repair protein RecF [Nitriliruptoraceae bacterium]|nr:DNA replication/repair protein RecF [Nitriliruptoraceae bacterium]
MHLTSVAVTDFRSWSQAELALAAGVTLLVGANAQGKTNLVEAIVRAATGASHRVASDTALVRMGADMAVVRLAATNDDGRERRLDVEVASGTRTRTRVDGADIRRASDAMGVVKVVMFSPEDVAIVRGDPDGRRRFLDDLLTQRRPAYGATRSDYDRVLRQRNLLLKQLRGMSGSAAAAAEATLESWTRQLVTLGATVLAARLAAVHTLAPRVDEVYRRVADRPEAVVLTHQASTGVATVGQPGAGVPDPGPLAEQLWEAVNSRADEERARGVTLVGPHRDDVDMAIGGMPARTHASQGEAWSLALALKVATHDVVAEVGDRPVVVLDDVFSELDSVRRQRLAEACQDFEQVVVTAAVEGDVPITGRIVDIEIRDGVSRASPRTQVPR